ncbi:MAG: HepT-like ribonuclease domain-containing protein [Thermoplasmata archaeon]
MGDIKGFIDIAIHQYWNVDKEIVWEIVQVH